MKRNRHIRKTILLRFLFGCILSFSVLAVCSKSSFLYPMNDWVDVHCFFTVGRGILHGMVPYRDLYEQKGPILYFVYSLAGLVSESSFLGVYLIEGILYAWFLYLSGRMAELLSDSECVYWPAAAYMAVSVPLTPAFLHGSSAEEFFLPILALGLLTVLRAIRAGRLLSDKEGFVLGLCAAAALWVKYTLCGMFAGLAAAVTIWYLTERRGRELFRLIGLFLLGFLTLSGLVAGWFAWRGALSDLWKVYFFDNLTHYSLPIRWTEYIGALLKQAKRNILWTFPAALGMLWLLLSGKRRKWESAAIWLSAVFLFAFTYIGGWQLPYYALVFAVFAPAGFAALDTGIRKVGMGKGTRFVRPAAAAAALLLTLSGPWLGYRFSVNTYLMHVRKEEIPQYRFAETIRQSGDRSLLNYGFLDGGFYYAAGVLPSSRFFCSLNIRLPEMWSSMQDSIREGRTAFVVTDRKTLDDGGTYRLVDCASYYFEGSIQDYFLFQREE